MRLDKFLKVSRLIKRRTLSKELSDKGRVDINGRVAKPSSEVKAGDILILHLGDRTLTVQIQAVKETVSKAGADDLYIVLEEVFKKAL